MGAIDAAALGPFKKLHTARPRTREVLPVSVAISPVGTISGESLKLLPPDVIFKAKMQ